MNLLPTTAAAAIRRAGPVRSHAGSAPWTPPVGACGRALGPWSWGC